MRKTSAVRGYAVLVALSAMVAILIVSVVNSFIGSEQQEPQRERISVERTAGEEEEQAAPEQDSDRERLWRGTM